MDSDVIGQLRGGLVVSCQPVVGGPLDRPDIVACMALAALDGGAVGLRIEGLENLRAVRAATDAPIIGLIKRDLDGYEPRITPLVSDVNDLARAGADIIAIDATDRARPETVEALFAAVVAADLLAMADCASAADAARAAGSGAAILGTTLSGYTGGPVPDGPDLGLVRSLTGLGRFVIAEGRLHSPADAAAAMRAGADAVVVGSAITRPEHVTGWFCEAIRSPQGPGR